MWCGVPLPAVAMVKRSGLARTSACHSCTVRAGKPSRTTSAKGVVANQETARKSSTRNCAWSFMKGCNTCEMTARNTVCPSGAAWAAARAPITPPAPARFSITMGWPSTPCTCGAMARARMSGLPPGGKPLIRRTGPAGCQSCAAAGRAAKAAGAASARRRVRAVMDGLRNMDGLTCCRNARRARVICAPSPARTRTRLRFAQMREGSP